MNLFSAIEISARGLSAERTRVNIASMNLANAHVTRTIDGGPYRAKSVIFEAVPYKPNADEVQDELKELDEFDGIDKIKEASFDTVLKDEMEKVQVVKVARVVDNPDPFKEVYDPTHPDADERGIVRLPNVNVVEEMVDLMTASRAYEAGVTALNTAKQMASKALEIGR